MGVRSITARRLTRAISSRLSRASILALNMMQPTLALHCVACGRKTSSFYLFDGKPFGCPYCRSSSRERFVLQAIEEGRIRKPESGRVLHVAPSERGIMNRLKANMDYMAADLLPGRYNGSKIHQLDLTMLSDRLKELGTFDLVYASHVLEHIQDDKAAIRSIYAALRPKGQAWILVPLGGEKTEEGELGMSTAERERRFGQWDHVRLYGMDIRERLALAGFAVEPLSACDLGCETMFSSGLDPADRIFICTKHT